MTRPIIVNLIPSWWSDLVNIINDQLIKYWLFLSAWTIRGSFSSYFTGDFARQFQSCLSHSSGTRLSLTRFLVDEPSRKRMSGDGCACGKESGTTCWKKSDFKSAMDAKTRHSDSFCCWRRNLKALKTLSPVIVAPVRAMLPLRSSCGSISSPASYMKSASSSAFDKTSAVTSDMSVSLRPGTANVPYFHPLFPSLP